MAIIDRCLSVLDEQEGKEKWVVRLMTGVRPRQASDALTRARKLGLARAVQADDGAWLWWLTPAGVERVKAWVGDSDRDW